MFFSSPVFFFCSVTGAFFLVLFFHFSVTGNFFFQFFFSSLRFFFSFLSGVGAGRVGPRKGGDQEGGGPEGVGFTK